MKSSQVTKEIIKQIHLSSKNKYIDLNVKQGARHHSGREHWQSLCHRNGTGCVSVSTAYKEMMM